VKRGVHEVQILGDVRGAECTPWYCRFERGVSETVDGLQCWFYVRASYAEALSTARSAKGVSAAVQSMRAIKVKMHGWKRFRTYVCLEDVVNYLSSGGESLDPRRFFERLYLLIQHVRLLRGLSAEKKERLLAKALACYSELLSTLYELYSELTP